MDRSRAVGLLAPALLFAFLIGASLFWRGQSQAKSDRQEAGDPCRPLIRAAERGEAAQVQQLLEEGCSANYQRPGVLSSPQDQNVRRQLKQRSDRSRFAGTPLLEIAAQNNDLPLLTLLLKQGADINGRGIYDYTALMRAASRANIEAVSLLLKAGADPNLRDTLFGETALHKATGFAGRRTEEPDSLTVRRRKTTALLIKGGADPNAADRRGRKPLASLRLK
ncbi:MAG: ankyrin repeat domain-containing protein [Cytophagales bacterium]|nr:ankyrin repeat domain-containing protein [Armatimonadota bacterium]